VCIFNVECSIPELLNESMLFLHFILIDVYLIALTIFKENHTKLFQINRKFRSGTVITFNYPNLEETNR